MGRRKFTTRRILPVRERKKWAVKKNRSDDCAKNSSVGYYGKEALLLELSKRERGLTR